MPKLTVKDLFDKKGKVKLTELYVTNALEAYAAEQAGIDICNNLREGGADCVILGCTEVCLLLNATTSPLPVFDTTQIHCSAAITEALKG